MRESKPPDPAPTLTITLPGVAELQDRDSLDHPWHIRVEVVGGPMDGHGASSTSTVFSLGRGRENDLSLPMDAMISSLHARIVREGRHHWLEDAGSRNGTYVAGQRIESRMLIGAGAKFRLGRTVLEFMPG